MNGLYIHIPFCNQKCHYCDFVSYPKHEHLINKYLSYLHKEAVLYEDFTNIKTIYIGGGTPSLLNIYQLEKIKEIVNLFSPKIIEFTIEANPESITEEKLVKYREIGINRLSLGLQSSDDTKLRILSRRYSYNEFIRIYSICRKYFDNINIDLMYGLPEQSYEEFIKDIKNVQSLDPEHISIYELHLNESNPLFTLLPNEDIRADMYEFLINSYSKYKQYEISNWSKNNFECKHNIIYWKNENYLGLGLSAGGHIDKSRYLNVKTFQKYFELIDNKQKPVLYFQNNVEKDIKETIVMNLRLLKGLNIKEFNNRYNKNFLKDYQNTVNKLIDLELCTIEKENFRLTKKGLMLANVVYENFV